MSKRGIPINPERFREIRKKALLTQEELAHRADCSVDLVQKAERKGTLPRVDPSYLNDLLAALGATLPDVIAEKQSDDITLTKEWKHLVEQGDLGGLEGLLCQNIHYEIPGPPIPLGEEFEPVTDGVYVGRPQVLAAFTTIFTVTAERKITIKEIHSVDDWLYVEGMFQWYAIALDADMSNPFINKMRFQNGRLADCRAMTSQALPDAQEALDLLGEMAAHRDEIA